MEGKISNCLKKLYLDFLNSDIIKLGYVHKMIKEGFQLGLTLGYHIDMSKYQIVEEKFKELPNYKSLIELLKKDGFENEINIFGIITYIFSDMLDYFEMCVTNYSFSQKNLITQLTFDESQLKEAILNSVCPASFSKKKDNFIIIFENLNIEDDFIINDSLEFIKLTKEDINKFNWQINNSSRVYTALKIDKDLLANEDIIPILGTLFRLYKKGDIKYKGIFEECQHLIKGSIYMPKKNSFSESDYMEHTPSSNHSNFDSWQEYKIKKEEVVEFSSFISTYINSMMNMPHSCKVYNMVSSSPLHLKIPLLFFVIESFFSDIDSEVVFRVSLYITRILNENSEFMQKLKKLYTIRSKIAHGDLVQAEKEIVKLYKNGSISVSGFKGATDELYEIIDRLWISLLKLEWKPKDSNKLIIPYLLNNK